MARRASSSTHPAWVVVGLVLLGGAMAGGHFVYTRVSDPYRTLAPLDVSIYLENANSLRGNAYKATGTIVEALAWSPDRGRLFSVEIGAGIVPVLVPQQHNHVNVEKGQRFAMRVEVDEQGVLRVVSLTKA